jgi:hypothetical protein
MSAVIQSLRELPQELIIAWLDALIDKVFSIPPSLRFSGDPLVAGKITMIFTMTASYHIIDKKRIIASSFEDTRSVSRSHYGGHDTQSVSNPSHEGFSGDVKEISMEELSLIIVSSEILGIQVEWSFSIGLTSDIARIESMKREGFSFTCGRNYSVSCMYKIYSIDEIM